MTVAYICRLTCLAPDTIEAVVDGRHRKRKPDASDAQLREFGVNPTQHHSAA